MTSRTVTSRTVPVRRTLSGALLLVLPVALVAGAVHLLGVDGLLRVAGAVALLGLAAVAVAVTAASLVVRRRLRELRHLPDLGRRYETHFDGVHLTGVDATSRGLVAHLATESAQTVVLDDDGTPDRVRLDGPSVVHCTVTEDGARRLQHAAVAGETVSVTAAGVIGLAGPVRTGLRIRTGAHLTGGR